MGTPGQHMYREARNALCRALPSLPVGDLLMLVECQHGTRGTFGNWVVWGSFLLDICQAAVVG